jgi:hypothetical protein
MTDAVSHAAQGQKMVEAITQSAKAGGQIKTRAVAARDKDETDNSEGQRSDHTAKTSRNSDDTAQKSVEKTGKTTKKSHHDDDKKDDKDKSFADTIDKLGTQSQPAATPDNAAAVASRVGWTADLVFRQPVAEHTKGESSLVATAGPDDGKSARLGSLLKQDSIVALLDARQRLLSAHDAKDMPTDDDAGETTVTTAMTVQSRQTHWIFGDTTQSNTRAPDTRAFETLMAKDGKTTPAVASVSAPQSTAPKDAIAKTSADSGVPIQASHVAAPDGASPRQTFDGQQGSTGSGRDQMPSGTTNDKRSNINAVASPDRVSLDATDLPGGMSGATQQVKNGVLNALTGDQGATPQPNTAQTFQGRPIIPGQVLRSIDLTLSPPDLGTVRLRLSLKSNSLDIDAEASKASTAKLLDDDRKGLEQSLRDAGYDVKNLKIADASASNNSGLNNSQNGAGSSFQDGSQARANFSGRQDGGNKQRRDGANPGQSQQQRPQHDNSQKGSPSSPTVAGRQSNAIYI